MANICDYRKQFIITAWLNLGYLIIGYSSSWSTSIFNNMHNWEEIPTAHLISRLRTFWVWIGFMIGGIVGPFMTAYLSNRIGRKKCLLIGGSICLLGYCITTLATSYVIVFIGRVVIGIANGIISVLHLIYIGEIASPKIRGALLTSAGVFFALGLIIMFASGFYLSYSSIGYLAISIVVLYILGCIYIPESPLYHAIRGEKEKAMDILKDLGRGNDLEEEYLNLLADDNHIRCPNWALREIISVRSNRKSLYMTVVLNVLGEFSAFSAVVYFTLEIFEISYPEASQLMITLLTFGTQLVSSLAAVFLVDWIGRKKLLLISCGGCSMAMVYLGAYYWVQHSGFYWMSFLAWLPLLSLMLTYASFNIGHGFIPETLLGEMYRPSVRASGAAISFGLGWLARIAASVLTSYYEDTIKAHGHIFFSVSALIELVGFVFVLRVLPETKGLSLRQINSVLSK